MCRAIEQIMPQILCRHLLYEPTTGLLIEQPNSLRRAITIVRVFDVLTLIFVAGNGYSLWSMMQQGLELQLLWPISWIVSLPYEQLGIYAIVVLAVFSSIVVLIRPSSRFYRWMMFASFFLLTAAINSFGKINHHLHGWLAVVFALCFLPTEQWQKQEIPLVIRQLVLQAVWFAQAWLALFYTMSGGMKLYGLFFQVVNGQAHALHPEGLALQILGRIVQTNTQPLLADIIIHTPWLGWLPYIVAFYLELFSFVILFRPKLHRIWGLGLVGMHIGNWLFMGIIFYTQILSLLLFFVYSPFLPSGFKRYNQLLDMPLIGGFFKLSQKLNSLYKLKI